jgi:hypothetical protein
LLAKEEDLGSLGGGLGVHDDCRGRDGFHYGDHRDLGNDWGCDDFDDWGDGSGNYWGSNGHGRGNSRGCDYGGDDSRGCDCGSDDSRGNGGDGNHRRGVALACGQTLALGINGESGSCAGVNASLVALELHHSLVNKEVELVKLALKSHLVVLDGLGKSGFDALALKDLNFLKKLLFTGIGGLDFSDEDCLLGLKSTNCRGSGSRH